MKEMKKFRKKVCSMILCAGMFLAAGASASALEVDYQYNGVKNNGEAGGLTVTVSHPEAEDVFSYAQGGVNQRWVATGDDRVHQLFFWADENTVIGTNSITLMWEDENTGLPESDVIYVDVFDDSKPVIQKATRSGTSVKITWDGARSKYFQLQYRVKGGTWKTAAPEYNTRETGMKYTFKNLKKGKYYQFRVRPVTPTYSWGSRYGQWSAAATVKVK